MVLMITIYGHDQHIWWWCCWWWPWWWRWHIRSSSHHVRAPPLPQENIFRLTRSPTSCRRIDKNTRLLIDLQCSGGNCDLNIGVVSGDVRFKCSPNILLVAQKQNQDQGRKMYVGALLFTKYGEGWWQKLALLLIPLSQNCYLLQVLSCLNRGPISVKRFWDSYRVWMLGGGLLVSYLIPEYTLNPLWWLHQIFLCHWHISTHYNISESIWKYFKKFAKSNFFKFSSNTNPQHSLFFERADWIFWQMHCN